MTNGVRITSQIVTAVVVAAGIDTGDPSGPCIHAPHALGYLATMISTRRLFARPSRCIRCNGSVHRSAVNQITG
jgi:hypothetical protein